jgi:hypothetical protein
MLRVFFKKDIKREKGRERRKGKGKGLNTTYEGNLVILSNLKIYVDLGCKW